MKAGSLRRRSNGTWQYRASFGGRPNGKPLVRAATFPAKLSQSQAEAEARKVRARWDGEQAREMDARQTVAWLVDEWAKEVDHSPTTEFRNRSIIARIKADLGHIKLEHLGAREIDQWCRELARPRKGHRTLTPNTILHYRRVLRAILQTGYDWDMLDRNPADRRRRKLKSVKTNQQVFVPTVEALAVMTRTANPKVRIAVQLSASTGARRGEIVALRWSHLRNGVLYIDTSAYKVPGRPVGYKSTKSGEPKEIPLGPHMLAMLAEYRVWLERMVEAAGGVLAPDAFIIPKLTADVNGTVGFAPDWYSQEWERLNLKAGTKFKLHGVRHMHGSVALDRGVSAAAAAKRQGHGVQVMLDRYVHSVDDADLRAARLVDDALGPLWAIGAGDEA